MRRTATKSGRKPPSPLAPIEGPWRGLTRAAFVLAIVLVIVRATMSEIIRDEVLPVPGTTAAPAVPGPATGLFLDLLFCGPAMLVLTRRAVDAGYVLRFAWSHIAMLLLACWTLLSVLWASDRFIAIVTAAHWVAALVLLWAMSQIIHSWLRLRLLAGVGFGLFLVLLAQGYYYRFVDLPDFQREWKEHQAEMLRQHGAEQNSTEAVQIGKNIESGDVMGFSTSRNTYAAVLVLLGMVSAGIALQRFTDRDHPGWIVPIEIILALSLLMLYRYVQSKTAYATPILGAGMAAVIWKKRSWIGSHARKLYSAAVVLFVLGALTLVGHGLKHGTLWQLSLTYRWQYWVGSARLFMHYPWLGVGWGNFGESYLTFRLPQAVEEIKDPHNFLVRAFVELGILGGAMMLIWMLRMWWELTQFPVSASEPDASQSPQASHRKAVLFLFLVPLIAIALSALVAIDWQQKSAWIILEVFKRVMFLILLIGGIGLATLRSMQRQELDNRPAPCLLWLMLTGLGLFLLHNLIDFSMFEPGPGFLFALLAGGALGMRLASPKRTRLGTGVTRAGIIFFGVAWLVAVGSGAWNISLAESLAQEGDELVRQNRPDAALAKYLDASKLISINPDYDYRAALLAPSNPMMAREMLAAAIAHDSKSVRYHRSMAELDVDQQDWTNALAEFGKAIELDPNNMGLRIEYADALSRRGQIALAQDQYRRALAVNDELPAEEIRRLPPATVARLRAAVAPHGSK
jgi:tetratricopeptide (TPR) repeat protein